MINPIISTGSAVDHCQDGEDSHLQYVTLRDAFAGCYLIGILADNDCNGGPSDYARHAYVFADAMLAERAKVKP